MILLSLRHTHGRVFGTLLELLLLWFYGSFGATIVMRVMVVVLCVPQWCFKIREVERQPGLVYFFKTWSRSSTIHANQNNNSNNRRNAIEIFGNSKSSDHTRTLQLHYIHVACNYKYLHANNNTLSLPHSIAPPSNTLIMKPSKKRSGSRIELYYRQPFILTPGI